MTTINITEKSTGNSSNYDDVIEYNLDSDPITLKINVNVGIDPEGNQQYVVVDRDFSQSKFTAKVVIENE